MSGIRSISGWRCWGLRATAPGSVVVAPLTAAPDLDGWAITERLLADLAPLASRVWLVADDVHELGPDINTHMIEFLRWPVPPDGGLVAGEPGQARRVRLPLARWFRPV
jgi:ATP/maltotriose-dependent transcriptional regulator MalT